MEEVTIEDREKTVLIFKLQKCKLSRYRQNNVGHGNKDRQHKKGIYRMILVIATSRLKCCSMSLPENLSLCAIC